MTEDFSFHCQPSVDASNPKRHGARVLSSFVFLDASASSEGWHVQWERVPPGKKLAPRSLSHVRGGNETDEAD